MPDAKDTGEFGETHPASKVVISSLFVLLMLGLYYLNFLHTEGMDFQMFYAAAEVLRHGEGAQLYNLPLQSQFQIRFTNAVGLVFNHPPVTALIFLPTAFFKLQYGYLLWTAISMAVLGICAGLLNRCVNVCRDSSWLFLLFFAFLPVHFSLMQGQVDVILLLAYVLALTAMKSSQDRLAGLALAIGLLKFHLVLPFVAIMAVRKRWSFVGGFLAGTLFFAMASVAICGWRILLAYPHLLLNLGSVPGSGINPNAMANLRGLYFFVLHREPPFTLLGIASAGALLSAARNWKTLESGFSATIVCTILVSYHLNPHDLILLLIPLAVTVKNLEWMSINGLIVASVALPVLLWLTLQAHCFAIMAIPLAVFGFLFRERMVPSEFLATAESGATGGSRAGGSDGK